MSRIQRLLIENNNRPEIQGQIREAALKGAAEAGFNMIFGDDNQVKYGNQASYENQEDAERAAWDRIQETVNLNQ